MSSEYRYGANLSINKNGISQSDSVNKVADMSGSEMGASVQTFTNAESQVSIFGCDSVGVLMIHNMSSAETLTIGLDDPITQIVARIPPGAPALIPGSATTLYGKSSGADIEAFVSVGEA
jgi:hypothetical protein